MLVTLSLSRASGVSLQAQIADQLREQIIAGRLPAGSEIPPSRELAAYYDLSRNTVVHAYERLTSEGYLTAVKGVRTIVAAAVPDSCLSVDIKGVTAKDKVPIIAHAPLVFSGDAPALPPRAKGSTVDFWPGRPNKALFPFSAWRTLADDALGAAGDNLTEYGDPSGLPDLRHAIAKHVATSRGIMCSADAVIVTAGVQDALNIIARILITAGTPVVLEDPCYASAMQTLKSYGASFYAVPVDRDGLMTSALPQAPVSLAYVTPSHQFPTGAALSEQRRREILLWAYRVGAYIVEDDYDSDYNFDGPPYLALAGADAGQCVIYVGTFSKSLGAGLRTGYMIVPPQLITAARKVRTLSNYGHPWLEQAILERFIHNGSYRRHLRKIRKAYSDTLDCLLSHLESKFGEIDIWGSHAGMHVMWLLPKEWSAQEFKTQLDAHGGVRVHTFASGGAYSHANLYTDRAILLGYAALAEEDIIRAVEIMDRVRAPKAIIDR